MNESNIQMVYYSINPWIGTVDKMPIWYVAGA